MRVAGSAGHADRLFDCGCRSGDPDDRILRILPDVRHGGPEAALLMTSLARTGRADPSLIEAARSGDAGALVSLISAAQPDVRRYALRNCRAADIDDAVQETLLLVYRRARAVARGGWVSAPERGGGAACLPPGDGLCGRASPS